MITLLRDNDMSSIVGGKVAETAALTVQATNIAPEAQASVQPDVKPSSPIKRDGFKGRFQLIVSMLFKRGGLKGLLRV